MTYFLPVAGSLPQPQASSTNHPVRKVCHENRSPARFAPRRACLAVAQEAKRSEAETKAITAIRKSGAHVLEIAQNDSHLEVAYHLNADATEQGPGVAGRELKDVVHLDLHGTKITDKGLEHLKGLTGLRIDCIIQLEPRCPWGPAGHMEGQGRTKMISGKCLEPACSR